MRSNCLLVILFLGISLSSFGQKKGQQPNSPFGQQQQQPSSWQGTGWAINNGYVVTNHHVVDGARTLRLKCAIGDSVFQYNGEVAVMDEEHDLAIIKITDSKFHGFGRLPYMLKTQLAEVGESVFVLGYPMTDVLGEELKLTTGVLSSRSGYQGDATCYQVSAPIQPGNSGGPLFDDDGNVIAVVNAKVTSAENVGYAIKAQYVLDLIAQLPSSNGVVPSNATLTGKSLPQKVKAVRGLIFTIYASTQSSSSSLRQSFPKSTSPSAPKDTRVIEMPYVDQSPAMGYLRIEKVTMSETETILDFKLSNRTRDGYCSSLNIAKETYIVVDGKRYNLKKAIGLAVAPEKTEFTGPVDNKIFRLVFPAIPQGATSFSMIEPGTDWKFYGISTK